MVGWGLRLAAVKVRRLSAQRELVWLMDEVRSMTGQGVTPVSLVLRYLVDGMPRVCEAYGLGTLHYDRVA